MALEQVIATATQLAASVEVGDFATARGQACSVTTLAGQAELQTVAHAAQRMLSALADIPVDEQELGLAMIELADETALLVQGELGP
ncbi:hypothetical protein [Luteibacter yeojuensis]|uniref:Uncharacterized protein n=1 Tax=Luteibacter yeojuensis TaxID=345309 RepID=A0A0F3KXC6_9GAMM|nr:hypothetical protein [Luteibacter yeojuensis]KJV34764.1 hypothetical protein VI08_09245 [Luteibacter yeojuensis]